HKGKIDSVFTLDDGEFEIIEAKILENSELVNKTLENSSIPDGIKIGIIVRDKKVFVPKKSFEFKLNDTVILLTSRSQLKKVEQLFRISEYY
ncbi:MAG: TrkA C-terminal domain-containing protein, partial [Pelagibacteraceae bacterium]